jgi:hypothetical protein
MITGITFENVLEALDACTTNVLFGLRPFDIGATMLTMEEFSERFRKDSTSSCYDGFSQFLIASTFDSRVEARARTALTNGLLASLPDWVRVRVLCVCVCIVYVCICLRYYLYIVTRLCAKQENGAFDIATFTEAYDLAQNDAGGSTRDYIERFGSRSQLSAAYIKGLDGFVTSFVDTIVDVLVTDTWTENNGRNSRTQNYFDGCNNTPGPLICSASSKETFLDIVIKAIPYLTTILGAVTSVMALVYQKLWMQLKEEHSVAQIALTQLQTPSEKKSNLIPPALDSSVYIEL